MKTAISIPDRLFNSADALARRLGLSRSRLYSTALAEFLAKHQATKITDRLNAVYGAQESRLDPGMRRVQRDAVTRSEW
jgi:metal-responsive CopG/Arc/MetJ family transcriptional regulator